MKSNPNAFLAEDKVICTTERGVEYTGVIDCYIGAGTGWNVKMDKESFGIEGTFTWPEKQLRKI